jgi:hypothetical protein
MKKCSTCAEEKPLSEYYKNKLSKDGYHGECKPCNRVRAKNWYKNNPTRSKHNRLSKAYGISFDEYTELLKKQNNNCAICSCKLLNNKDTCVDHCHTTSIVRGVLCTNCNILLGQAKDSLEILKSAQKYLQKHAKKFLKK